MSPHNIELNLYTGHRLGADGEARVRNGVEPPVSGRAALLLPDGVATLLRHRVRARRRPHVPHAAPAAAARGARPLLLGRDLAGAQLPAREGHHLSRSETGQRAARPRGPHQADRLRNVQGRHPSGRHDVHLLRHAQLHRARDPARRGLQLQVGFITYLALINFHCRLLNSRHIFIEIVV